MFGRRMMNNVRRYGLMPEEIFSKKNRTADDGTLSKVLFFDISRQTRRPAGVASVDAENCYDRVAHAMASLVFQAFGVWGELVETMLATIQEMTQQSLPALRPQSRPKVYARVTAQHQRGGRLSVSSF